MSQVRLYSDEDAMNRALVQALRARGIDVETTLDVGMIGTPDEQHLSYATSQGRVLYSFNVADYYTLHTDIIGRGQSHAGIILARQSNFSTGEQMRRVLKLIAGRSAEEMENQVEFLSAWD